MAQRTEKIMACGKQKEDYVSENSQGIQLDSTTLSERKSNRRKRKKEGKERKKSVCITTCLTYVLLVCSDGRSLAAVKF